jgi:hypothetical protein
MRVLAAILLLGLAGCTTVKPIVHWTCVACQTLVSSGVCAYGEKLPAKVEVPQCAAGKVLVIENWKAVSREGKTPVLGCEKP